MAGRLLAGAAVAAVIAVGAMAPATAQTEEPVVIGRINETVVTLDMLNLAVEEYGQALAQYPPDSHLQLVLGPVMDMALLADAAVAEGLEQSPEFERRMAYLRLRALYETYFEVILVGGVTDEEIQEFYAAETANFQPEEEVRASHILVETEAEAQQILDDLAGGANFAQIAAQFSLDTGSGAAGGDLGYFVHADMVTPFADAAFALGVGETSAPVQSEFGWHIIRVFDIRTSAPPPIETVSDQIRQYLAEQNLETTLNETAAAADVELFTELLDPNPVLPPAGGDAPAGDAAADEGSGADGE
jgi:peptidyl-prolyl cis-trans isomerase C